MSPDAQNAHQTMVFAQMNQWWESGGRNSWIENDLVSAYVRRGPLFFGGQYWDAMTLARVYIKNSEVEERSGHLAPILMWMSNICPTPLLMVENVISPRMVDILSRRAWCFVYAYGPPLAYRLRGNLGRGRGVPGKR